MSNKIIKIFGSKWVFWAIVAIFCFEAGWIAVSGVHSGSSLIFDEPSHLAFIKYMSTKANPFFYSQDQSVDYLGPVFRNTSILYYSFFGYFYLLISKIITSFIVQVIILRFLHIAFFVVGAFYVKKSFKLLKMSGPQSNLAIFILLMLPMVPFLAATINYDNALFMMGSINIYYAIKIFINRKIIANDFLIFLLTGLASILIKFTYIPIFLTTIILFFILKHGVRVNSILTTIKRKNTWNAAKILIVFLILILSVLSVERFALNIYKYGGLTATCTKTLGVERCLSYGLYQREASLKNNNKSNIASFDVYVNKWTKEMVNGNLYVAHRINIGNDIVAIPAILLRLFIWALIAFGLAAFFYSLHITKKNKQMIFVLIISIAYLSVLFLYNYLDYKKLGVVLGVQSRYMLIVLPYLIGIIVYSASLAIKSKQIKSTLLVFSVAILLLTGGFVSYIKYSDSRWYWNNPTIIRMNKVAKKLML